MDRGNCEEENHERLIAWLESRWEDPAEHEAAGRPRRRYYRFTPDGAERARLALEPARRPGAAVPLHAAPRSGQPGAQA